METNSIHPLYKKAKAKKQLYNNLCFICEENEGGNRAIDMTSSVNTDRYILITVLLPFFSFFFSSFSLTYLNTRSHN